MGIQQHYAASLEQKSNKMQETALTIGIAVTGNKFLTLDSLFEAEGPDVAAVYQAALDILSNWRAAQALGFNPSPALELAKNPASTRCPLQRSLVWS